MQLQQGTLLQGDKYKIERVLGQGGFGITYLATQKISVQGPLGTIDTQILVTIKEFFMKDFCNRNNNDSIVSVPSVGSKELVEKFRQKFKKEAVNISKLNHPNIIKVLDVFDENDTSYYVMEFIDGGSLSELISTKGKLSEKESLSFVYQTAEALKCIHAMNMNHLDIKPGNLLYRKNGEIVLIDFGMSKNYDVQGEQTTSTPIGISVGYAPIEQSRVGGVSTFSPATDIYSLGATMYKMLTGNTPPEASVIVDDGLPDMPDYVSENLRKVIEKSMEPRRKDRFQSIEAFLAAIDLPSGSTVINQETIFAENVRVINDSSNNNKQSSSDESLSNAITSDMPTFIREDENEATRIISLEMVQKSIIENADFVDLGLSVKWCSCNLGANSPEEYGDFYPWNISNECKIIADDISGTEEDRAYVISKGKYRTPTRKQFKELMDRCRWSWTTFKGVVGCKVTGPSGKSIFMPAAGRLANCGHYREKEYGYYWSSTKYNYNCACYMYFYKEDYDLQVELTNIQRNIRPVSD